MPTSNSRTAYNHLWTRKQGKIAKKEKYDQQAKRMVLVFATLNFAGTQAPPCHFGYPRINNILRNSQIKTKTSVECYLL
jgi:hypothetical protein